MDGIFWLWESIPCLLMFWLLKSSEHQQAWYWLCGTDNMYWCFRVNFIDLGQAKSKIQFKMWIYLLKSLKQFSMMLGAKFRVVIFKLILVTDGWDIFCEIALRLLQVMACCLTAPSHYLNQPISMPPYGIIRSLRPRWNRHHFADDIFKCILLNENMLNSIKISLKFIPKGPINNIPALVQIMAWRRPGDKPLSEPMVVSLLTYICVTRPQWVRPKWVNEFKIWPCLYHHLKILRISQE